MGMAEFFMWLHKGKMPDSHVMLRTIKRQIRTINISGEWQGILAFNRQWRVEAEKKVIICSIQQGTTLNQKVDNNSFLPSRLASREGWWTLLRIEPDSSTLSFARDRFGALPLYLYHGDADFILSSRIARIRTALPGRCSIDLERLVGSSISLLPPYFGKQTLFNDVTDVECGKIVRIDLDSRCQHASSYLPRHPRPQLWKPRDDAVLTQAAHSLRSHVQASLARHLGSAPNLALPLSGGVDSSILAVELKKAGAGFSPFTVTYPEAGGGPPDESPLVKLTARSLGLKVNWINVKGEGLLDVTRDLIGLHEYPVSYGMLVAFRMQEEIEGKGFKTLVSAMGGDGVFAGGSTWWLGALTCSHPFSGMAEWLRSRNFIRATTFLSGILTFASPVTRRWLNSGRFSAYPWVKIRPSYPRWYDSLAKDYFAYRTEHEHHRVLHDVFNDEYRRITHFGLRHILPFIDGELIDYARRIPPSFVLSRGWNKYLARVAYSEDLPGEVIWNPTKMGFEAPVERWVRGPWKEEICQTLSSSTLMSELFDIDHVINRFRIIPPALLFRLYSTARFLESYS